MPSKIKRCRSELRLAHEIVSTDPKRARRIAESLLEQVEGFDELLGEVLSVLGLARQCCGDREGAYSAFKSASSVEPCRLKKGHIYRRWAILELDLDRHEEALRKVSKGLALIESSDPPNRDKAEGLITRGMVFWHNGEFDKAAEDSRDALKLIHPKKDSKLHLGAVHNLGLALLFGGRDVAGIKEALKTLDEAARLLRRYRIPSKSMQGAMILWTKGLAHRMAGADERAEAFMQKASAIFLELGWYSQWTQVSLDIIELHIHYNKWGLVKKLLGDMLQHATDAKIIAVLIRFYDAIQADVVSVTEEMLCEVYARIHRGERKPPILGTPKSEWEPIGF